MSIPDATRDPRYYMQTEMLKIADIASPGINAINVNQSSNLFMQSRTLSTASQTHGCVMIRSCQIAAFRRGHASRTLRVLELVS